MWSIGFHLLLDFIQTLVTMLFLLWNIIIVIARLMDVKSVPAGLIGSDEALHFDEIAKTLHYMEKNPETIQEILSKDAPLVEGDIISATDRNAVPNIWPTPDFAYVINAEISHRTEDILKAMQMISNKTCLTFHQLENETDYLYFQHSLGCASIVGFSGGAQPIFIGSACSVGNIVHEILYALGFYHEHTRTDREKYITILNENIMAGSEMNFQKRYGNTFNIPYDIDSIMHYGSGYFSSNGLPTIVPLHTAKEMGQRVKLTELDIERIRTLYDCDLRKEPDPVHDMTTTSATPSLTLNQSSRTTRWRKNTKERAKIN